MSYSVTTLSPPYHLVRGMDERAEFHGFLGDQRSPGLQPRFRNPAEWSIYCRIRFKR